MFIYGHILFGAFSKGQLLAAQAYISKAAAGIKILCMTI